MEGRLGSGGSGRSSWATRFSRHSIIRFVVLAAGTGITKLTEMLNMPLPIEASPAIFIRYRSPPNLVHSIISSPEMDVRQSTEGTLLAAEDYLDDSLENTPAAIALRTASTIQNELHWVISIDPELAGVGLRPIPIDGTPIIGYLRSAQSAPGLSMSNWNQLNVVVVFKCAPWQRTVLAWGVVRNVGVFFP